MKRKSRFLALVLFALACICSSVMAFAVAGVAASAVTGYYDADGNELVYAFDANGVSTQEVYTDKAGTERLYYGMQSGSYVYSESASSFTLPGQTIVLGGELDVTKPIDISLKLSPTNGTSTHRLLLCVFESYEDMLTAGPDGWNSSAYNTKLSAWTYVDSTHAYFNNWAVGNFLSKNGSLTEELTSLKLCFAKDGANSKAYLNGVHFADLGIAQSAFTTGKAVISLTSLDGGCTDVTAKVVNSATVDGYYDETGIGFAYDFDKNGVSPQIVYSDASGTVRTFYGIQDYVQGDEYSSFTLPSAFVALGGELDVNKPISIKLKVTSYSDATPQMYMGFFDNYKSMLDAGDASCQKGKMVAWGNIDPTHRYYNNWAIGNYLSTTGNYTADLCELKLVIGETVAESKAYVNGTHFADLSVAKSDFATGKVVISFLAQDWVKIDAKVVNVEEEVPEQPKTVNVNFASNVDKFTLSKQEITEGTTITEPTAPTLVGYTFVGWYTDDTYATQFDFSTAISEDTTIYAKYEQVKYYNANGEELEFIFDENGVSSQDVYTDKNQTERKYYGIQDYVKGRGYSSFTLPSQCVVLGNNLDVTKPINVSLKIGSYSSAVPQIILGMFDNYTDAITAGADSWNSGVYNTKLVAFGHIDSTHERYNNWQIGSALSTNGKYDTEMTILTFVIGETVSESFAYVNGVKFADLGVCRNDFETGKATFTLTAFDWVKVEANVVNAEKVTVDFNSNIQSFSLNSVELYTGFLLEEQTAPTIENCEFIGWYTDESATTVFDFNKPIAESTTVYAKYVDNSKVYHTITFKSTTGAFDDVVTDVEEGTVYEIPDGIFEYEGYQITWVDADGNDWDESTVITDNIDLYAKWTEKDLILYHKYNGVVDESYVYEYLQEENGWDMEYTNWQNGDTFVDENGNDVICSYYGGWDPDSSFITQDTFTRILLMGQGHIANLKQLDVTKEIVIKYSVNNWDFANGNDGFGSYINIQLFDTLVNALKVVPNNCNADAGAKVSLVTATNAKHNYYNAITDLLSEATSQNLDWKQDAKIEIRIYISEDGTQNYLKVNGEVVDGALASVKQSDFIGGYAYLHVKNFGSTHCFDILVSQTSNISITDTANGTVSADIDISKPVLFKDAITLTMTPAQGYGVKSVTVGEDVYFADENNQVVIYKGWEDEVVVVEFATTYTCTFVTNGGTNVAEQEICEGEKFYKPSNPKKQGYKFVGWFTDEELTNEFDFKQDVNSSVTLYAKWESTSSKTSKSGCGSNFGVSASVVFAACISGVAIVFIKRKKI